MTKNLKATLIILLGATALVLVAVVARPGAPASGPGSTSSAPVGGTTPDPAALVSADVLVRADSHRLSTAPDGKVTLVEFLDFECEACAAVYPVVEDLRAAYGDRITFVVRYFPIPSHANAENAAIAVEAAAQQDRFEEMYQRMYATQPQWSEQEESKAPLFRTFAAELGLDLAAYDRAVADPATRTRVLADRTDGTTAGVQGTPTFFLNGARLQPRSVEEFRAAIDAELNR